MPFRSEKQRAYLWANHPEIARRWVDEGKGNMEKKFGIKTQGTTVSGNSPVGSAGQPSGKGLKGHEKNDERRFSAINRRLSKMNKDNGKKN